MNISQKVLPRTKWLQTKRHKWLLFSDVPNFVQSRLTYKGKLSNDLCWLHNINLPRRLLQIIGTRHALWNTKEEVLLKCHRRALQTAIGCGVAWNQIAEGRFIHSFVNKMSHLGRVVGCPLTADGLAILNLLVGSLLKVASSHWKKYQVLLNFLFAFSFSRRWLTVWKTGGPGGSTHPLLHCPGWSWPFFHCPSIISAGRDSNGPVREWVAMEIALQINAITLASAAIYGLWEQAALKQRVLEKPLRPH